MSRCRGLEELNALVYLWVVSQWSVVGNPDGSDP